MTLSIILNIFVSISNKIKISFFCKNQKKYFLPSVVAFLTNVVLDRPHRGNLIEINREKLGRPGQTFSPFENLLELCLKHQHKHVFHWILRILLRTPFLQNTSRRQLLVWVEAVAQKCSVKKVRVSFFIKWQASGCFCMKIPNECSLKLKK